MENKMSRFDDRKQPNLCKSNGISDGSITILDTIGIEVRQYSILVRSEFDTDTP